MMPNLFLFLIADIVTLLYLNLSRSNLTDNGCHKFSSKSLLGWHKSKFIIIIFFLNYVSFSGLKALRVLNLGFNDISDAVLIHLKGASCPFFIFYHFYL